MLDSKITQYLSLYCLVSPKLPFSNLKSIQAARAIYNCIQTPPATAACCYSASGKGEELKINHLKLILAGLLGRPLSAAKSSKMKQKGNFKPVQCIRMRTIAKVKRPTAGGVTSGEKGPLQIHIFSSGAFAPRAP